MHGALLQVAISVAGTVTAALLLSAARSVLQMTRTVHRTAGAVTQLVENVDTLTGRVEDLERGRRRPSGPHKTTRQGFPI